MVLLGGEFMAGMQCRCGNILSTTACPNNIELHVYTDEEWDELLDCEVIVPWEIKEPKHDVWRCPKCKRIYVFEQGGNKVIMTYALEPDI